jgi:hypothetical protein
LTGERKSCLSLDLEWTAQSDGPVKDGNGQVGVEPVVGFRAACSKLEDRWVRADLEPLAEISLSVEVGHDSHVGATTKAGNLSESSRSAQSEDDKAQKSAEKFKLSRVDKIQADFQLTSA